MVKEDRESWRVKEDRESWRVKEDPALGVGLSNQLASSTTNSRELRFQVILQNF